MIIGQKQRSCNGGNVPEDRTKRTGRIGRSSSCGSAVFRVPPPTFRPATGPAPTTQPTPGLGRWSDDGGRILCNFPARQDLPPGSIGAGLRSGCPATRTGSEERRCVCLNRIRGREKNSKKSVCVACLPAERDLGFGCAGRSRTTGLNPNSEDGCPNRSRQRQTRREAGTQSYGLLSVRGGTV